MGIAEKVFMVRSQRSRSWLTYNGGGIHFDSGTKVTRFILSTSFAQFFNTWFYMRKAHKVPVISTGVPRDLETFGEHQLTQESLKNGYKNRWASEKESLVD